MKNFSFMLALFLAALFLLNSCGKYEEGPAFSLSSKTSRVTGIWKYDKKFINGNQTELDEFEKAVELDIMKDGKGKAVYTIINIDLEWEFSSDKLNFKYRLIFSPELEALLDDMGLSYLKNWQESEILRLTNKEFWLRDVQTNEGVSTETISHLLKI